MSPLVTPPGWPSAVRPLDAPRWELTADVVEAAIEAWLTDGATPRPP